MNDKTTTKLIERSEKMRANGENTIYKVKEPKNKDKSWTGLLTIGTKSNGKTKQKRFFGKTKSEVAKLMRDYRQVNLAPIQEQTFEQVFREMLNERTKNKVLKSSTTTLYESIYNACLSKYFGAKQMDKIDYKYVKQAFIELEESYTNSYLHKVKNLGTMVYKYVAID